MVNCTWMVLVIFGVARFSKMVGKAVNHRKPRRRLNERNVNPGWSTWGSWSVCSERKCCRHGVMVRHRNCAKGPCTGIESEAEDCPRRGCKGKVMILLKVHKRCNNSMNKSVIPVKPTIINFQNLSMNKHVFLLYI